MSLLAVCVPFLEKCLLILFAHYKMGLFIFSLLGCKRNIYSHKTQSLISHMICNFFFSVLWVIFLLSGEYYSSQSF